LQRACFFRMQRVQQAAHPCRLRATETPAGRRLPLLPHSLTRYKCTVAALSTLVSTCEPPTRLPRGALACRCVLQCAHTCCFKQDAHCPAKRRARLDGLLGCGRDLWLAEHHHFGAVLHVLDSQAKCPELGASAVCQQPSLAVVAPARLQLLCRARAKQRHATTWCRSEALCCRYAYVYARGYHACCRYSYRMRCQVLPDATGWYV
jgi:hypothetical protein